MFMLQMQRQHDLSKLFLYYILFSLQITPDETGGSAVDKGQPTVDPRGSYVHIKHRGPSLVLYSRLRPLFISYKITGLIEACD